MDSDGETAQHKTIIRGCWPTSSCQVVGATVESNVKVFRECCTEEECNGAQIVQLSLLLTVCCLVTLFWSLNM